MLKKRLIPKLLIKFNKNNNPVLVNSFQYNKYKLIGNPVSQAKIFEASLTNLLFLIAIELTHTLSAPLINNNIPLRKI